jgi:SAM-dependent methyltransferase
MPANVSAERKALARAYGNKINITGIDVSTPLLEHARKRVEAGGLQNICFLEADAQTHDFTPARYDRLVSRFGVMFFSDPALAFKNLAKAIKPGGEMHFVAWSSVERNPWFQIALDIAISRLGEPAPVDAKEPGPLAFADTGYLADILHRAGLEDFNISEEKISIGTNLALTEMARLASNLGPAVRLLKEKDGSKNDADAIYTEVLDAFRQFQSGDRIDIPATIVVVRANF